MTTEQKAKAYDEVIKRAKSLYKTAEPLSACNVLLEAVLPELKENKDERIRKWLIHYFTEVCDNVSEKEKKDVLAWLKSLKPPYYCDDCKLKKSIQGWKPSEIQKDCIEQIIDGEPYNRDVLIGLFNDLKKL